MGSDCHPASAHSLLFARQGSCSLRSQAAHHFSFLHRSFQNTLVPFWPASTPHARRTPLSLGSGGNPSTEVMRVEGRAGAGLCGQRDGKGGKGIRATFCGQHSWLTTNLLKKKNFVLLVLYPFDKEKLTEFSTSS